MVRRRSVSATSAGNEHWGAGRSPSWSKTHVLHVPCGLMKLYASAQSGSLCLWILLQDWKSTASKRKKSSPSSEGTNQSARQEKQYNSHNTITEKIDHLECICTLAGCRYTIWIWDQWMSTWANTMTIKSRHVSLMHSGTCISLELVLYMVQESLSIVTLHLWYVFFSFSVHNYRRGSVLQYNVWIFLRMIFFHCGKFRCSPPRRCRIRHWSRPPHLCCYNGFLI